MKAFATVTVLVLLWAFVSADISTVSECPLSMNKLECQVRTVSQELTPMSSTNEHQQQYPSLTTQNIIKAFAYDASNTERLQQIEQHFSKRILDSYHSAVSGQGNLRDPTAKPEQLHLSLSEHAGNISVLWTTSTESNHSKVCWWPELSPVEVCARGSTWTYNPISRLPWSGNLHGAHMFPISGGARYCYKVGDPVINIWSDVVCFTGPTLQGKDNLTIALGGDMGSVQLFGHYVAAQMLNDDINGSVHFDAFWLLGDIAYSTLDPPKYNFEFYWDMFMVQEEPLVNHVPFLVTYGNHDFSGGDSGAFVNRFRMPQGGKGNQNFYWSYTHGPIFFVSMCTEIALNPAECDYTPGSKQYLWLEQQLGSVNRTATPWLILGGHRPMYSSDDSTDSGPLQQYMEPLLRRYGVDVELAGHMHDTEVMSPVFNNTPFMSGVKQTGATSFVYTSPTAPVHLTLGNLGGLIDSRFRTPQPAWSMYRNGTLFDNAYGYTRMYVTRHSLHFKTFKEADGSVMWDLLITK